MLSPPLGLLYIATAASKADHDVKLIDEQLYDRVTIPKIIEIVKDFNPNIFGLSLNTLSYNYGVDIAREVKKIFPKVRVVVGGAHITCIGRKSFF